MAGGQPLDRDRVIEVACMLAVDRHRLHRTKIHPPREIFFTDDGAEPVRFGDAFVAVRVGNAVLADDDLDIDAGRVDVAEHFDDAADRIAGGGRPANDFGGDHVARLRAVRIAAGHLDVEHDAAIERRDEAEAAGVDHVAADHGRGAALEDADDAPFGAAVAAALDAHDDAVAVHRFVQIRAGDVDVAFDAIELAFGADERIPLRMHLQPPDNEIHLLGQPIMAVPGLNQGADGYEVLQPAAEGGALIAGDFQCLQQFANRRRMVDLLAHRPQNLLVSQHA